MSRILWRHAALVTLAEERGWGWIPDGAMLTVGEQIAWIGNDRDLPVSLRVDVEHDLQGAVVTPGLVDCHTHLIYGGHRADEFEQRIQGQSYAQIAAKGGGIHSTVRATRVATEDRLWTDAKRRMFALRADGVTTVEIKSGYGLTLADEARCLRICRRLGEEAISVKATYLAAHTLPDEYACQSDSYIDAVCEWLPVLNAQGLVDAVDAYCEHLAFSPSQVRRVFAVAKALGLPIKLHAEQLSYQGGAELAAEFGAMSCDHLEWLSPQGIAAMRALGTVAVLLPGAYYFTGESRMPPIAALRDSAVPMAIASDHNPGTSPMLSMRMVLNMACLMFHLTPEEALRGATVVGARALGLKDRGRLMVGQRADFVAWDVTHPSELAYWMGSNPCRRLVVGGSEVNLGDRWL